VTLERQGAGLPVEVVPQPRLGAFRPARRAALDPEPRAETAVERWAHLLDADFRGSLPAAQLPNWEPQQLDAEPRWVGDSKQLVQGAREQLVRGARE
jgi:hypothetical protein